MTYHSMSGSYVKVDFSAAHISVNHRKEKVKKVQGKLGQSPDILNISKAQSLVTLSEIPPL